jgi:Tfp pilus assembly protein PilO
MAMNPRDPAFQKKVLLVALPLALAVVYYVQFYGARVEQIDQLEIRVETLQAQNNALRAIVARYGSNLDQRVAIFGEHLGQLEQLIPNREDVPHLVNQITEAAGTTGVVLTGIRPGGETPGDYYARQTYDLQVLGDYHAVAEYLTAIGSMPRIVRSAHLQLNRVAGESTPGGAPLLRASFRIDTYVMPTPGEPPPAGQEG